MSVSRIVEIGTSKLSQNNKGNVFLSPVHTGDSDFGDSPKTFAELPQWRRRL